MIYLLKLWFSIAMWVYQSVTVNLRPLGKSRSIVRKFRQLIRGPPSPYLWSHFFGFHYLTGWFLVRFLEFLKIPKSSISEVSSPKLGRLQTSTTWPSSAQLCQPWGGFSWVPSFMCSLLGRYGISPAELYPQTFPERFKRPWISAK